MKKNVMMRLAAILLVCVLASTCGISGTYAKYVTEGTAGDTARVAKFGVKVNSDGTLFLVNYEKDDGTFTLVGNTVVSSNEWKLVAPGTKHSLTEVGLTGTPEVAVRVSYTADLALNGWKLSDGSVYCPVIFTVEGHTYGMVGTSAEYTFESIEVLELAVEQAIAAHTKDYVANTDLAKISLDDAVSVSWEWPFSTSPENDVKDTDLGDLAAAGYHAVIKLDITTIVTQID